MKNIVIVSTYPEFGSQNIGDQLITDSVISNITNIANLRNIKTCIKVIFRADKWDDIKETIYNSDFIIFACLAIRPKMSTNEYPYLDKIISMNKPFGVISAGTDLPVHQRSYDMCKLFTQETICLLENINKKASFFSTRGVLTQSFCNLLNLHNSFFSGDIAFYSEDNADKNFKQTNIIKNISISSPHRAEMYSDSLTTLILGLKKLFPNSNLKLIQHGKSDFFDGFCKKHNIGLVEAYKDKHKGLSTYDNTDLHVGYRVHAHVSSLKRKIPSYLLEQDGRGADYGLTLNVKCSVPNYIESIDFTDRVLNRLKIKKHSKMVGSMPANLILSMIEADKKDGFTKFCYLEEQVDWFSKNHADYLISIFE